MGRAGRRVYRALLRLCPRPFREAHAEEMVLWFDAHARETRSRGSRTAWVGFWGLILRDTIKTAIRERFDRSGGSPPGPDGFRGRVAGRSAHDIGAALRSVARRPGFTLLAASTLAIGIASATTVYTAVHSLLLTPLPYDHPERLVRVGKISDGRAGILAVSAPDFEDLRARARSFESLSGTTTTNLTLIGSVEGPAQIVPAAIVTTEFFQVLGRSPAVGRAWGPAEDRIEGDRVIVLSHGLWERNWGADPRIVGTQVQLGDHSYAVIGIMPPDFRPPEALGQRSTQAWVSFSSIQEDLRTDRRNQFIRAMGLLKPGGDISVGRQELQALGPVLSEEYPDAGERAFGLAPLHAETVGSIGSTMWPLLGGAVLLLGIACVNVANLLLIRANERKRELSVRAAIGAGRGDLIRQLWWESLAVGILGGVLAGPLAWVGVMAFRATAPPGIPRIAELSGGTTVFWVAGAIAVATSVLFGVFPAVAGTRASLASTLGHGSAGHGGSASEGWARDFLVALTAACSILLVVSAGLLGMSLLKLSQTELGFDPRDVQVVAVSHPDGSDDERRAFFSQLVDRIAAQPGVLEVGATTSLPLAGGRSMVRVTSSGMVLSEDDRERGGYPVFYQSVTHGYFEAMTMRMARGRAFVRADDEGGRPVVIVNQALAQRMESVGEVIGRRLAFSEETFGPEAFEVVGVLEDVRDSSVDAEGAPTIYLAYPQAPAARMEVVAKTSSGSAGTLAAMRVEVAALRADLPVRRSTTMSEVAAGSIAVNRFFTGSVTAFALLALALAFVGVYGTLSYAVAQRRRELGVRIVLGATGASVLRSTMRRTMTSVAFGVGVGALAALAVTRVLTSLLYGVSAQDPLTFLMAVSTVLAAAALASSVPALRAARLDPVDSLRSN